MSKIPMTIRPTILCLIAGIFLSAGLLSPSIAQTASHPAIGQNHSDPNHTERTPRP
jgi:hypothetical protein